MNMFKIIGRDGKARRGKLKTFHGIIDTPNFIPVGTQATVKTLSPDELKNIGIQVILANAYHLSLRPTPELIEKLGGLHKFMNWNGPIMTDSGGFQVFSLGVALTHGVGKWYKETDVAPRPSLTKITPQGVYFRSHLDGSQHFLDPKRSIDIQLKLGADLLVAFDDHESPKHSFAETLKSLELTEKWELESLKAFKSAKKAGDALLYGVVHGGDFKELRVRSAKFVDKYFDAIALGGAQKNKAGLYQTIDWTLANVAEQKPRHLLGIGEVEDILEAVERGIDLFDCASPMRRARNGSLYLLPISGGRKETNFCLDIKNAKFAADKNPIDPKCNCYTCQNFSRAYLRHLYKAGEMLYHRLATYHNVYFIVSLMEKIRVSIEKGEFQKFKKAFLGQKKRKP